MANYNNGNFIDARLLQPSNAYYGHGPSQQQQYNNIPGPRTTRPPIDAAESSSSMFDFMTYRDPIEIDENAQSILSHIEETMQEERMYTSSDDPIGIFWKIKVFLKKCSCLGLEERYLSTALVTMMGDEARYRCLELYQIHGTDWRSIAAKMTNEFDCISQRFIRVMAWERMTLQSFITTHEKAQNKPFSKVVYMFLDKLEWLKHSLPMNMQTESTLSSHFLRGLLGHPRTKRVAAIVGSRSGLTAVEISHSVAATLAFQESGSNYSTTKA